jgi:hypothetical protein
LTLEFIFSVVLKIHCMNGTYRIEAWQKYGLLKYFFAYLTDK